MFKRITLSHILVFLLISTAVDAQPTSRPVAPPHAALRKPDPSFSPLVVTLGSSILFVGFFIIFFCHCSNMDPDVGDHVGSIANCSSCGPQGIDPKLLNSFPILVYSAIKHLKLGSAGLEYCAVCLSEFEHQDTLRLLPKCNHMFHPECIDAWLASHVTCPVCRARLTPEHHHGDKNQVNQVMIAIPNEVSAHQEFDESSAVGTELSSGEGSLGRCHSMDQSLGLDEIGEKDMERYTLRLSEDVMKQMVMNHGGI